MEEENKEILEPERKKKGKIGLICLIVSIIATLFAFIESFISLVLGIAAIVLAIIGFTKKDVKKVAPVIGLIFGILAVILSGFGAEDSDSSSSGNASTVFEESNKLTEEEFRDKCKEYDTTEMARYLHKLDDKYVMVTVQVSQVIKDGDYSYYRCYAMGKDGYYDGAEICVNDYRENQEPKVLEDDIITVYGIYSTTTITRSLSNTDEELPCIETRYLDIKDVK